MRNKLCKNAISLLNTTKEITGCFLVLTIAVVAISDAQAMKPKGGWKGNKVKPQSTINESYDGVSLRNRSNSDEEKERQLKAKFESEHPELLGNYKNLVAGPLKEVEYSEEWRGSSSVGLLIEMSNKTISVKRALKEIAKQVEQTFPTITRTEVEKASGKARRKLAFIDNLSRVSVENWGERVDKSSNTTWKEYMDLMRAVNEEGYKRGVFTRTMKKGSSFEHDYELEVQKERKSPLRSVNSAQKKLFPAWGRFKKARKQNEGVRYADFENEQDQATRDEWRMQAKEDLACLIQFCEFVQGELKAPLATAIAIKAIRELPSLSNQTKLKTDLDFAQESAEEVKKAREQQERERKAAFERPSLRTVLNRLSSSFWWSKPSGQRSPGNEQKPQNNQKEDEEL